MAKAVALVSAVCFLALATLAHGHNKNVFDVEGDVYCDPCRVQFQTRISQKLPGAKVRLDCINTDTNNVTFSVEGVTDENGHYVLRVAHDHASDVCEVKVVSSPRPDCSEKMNEDDTSRIECTDNSGMHTDVRYANPIGFMTKEIIPECHQVLEEIAFHVNNE